MRLTHEVNLWYGLVLIVVTKLGEFSGDALLDEPLFLMSHRSLLLLGGLSRSDLGIILVIDDRLLTFATDLMMEAMRIPSGLQLRHSCYCKVIVRCIFLVAPATTITLLLAPVKVSDLILIQLSLQTVHLATFLGARPTTQVVGLLWGLRSGATSIKEAGLRLSNNLCVTDSTFTIKTSSASMTIRQRRKQSILHTFATFATLRMIRIALMFHMLLGQFLVRRHWNRWKRVAQVRLRHVISLLISLHQRLL